VTSSKCPLISPIQVPRSDKAVQTKPVRLLRKGFGKQMSFKCGVKGRGSDRWWERRWWLWLAECINRLATFLKTWTAGLLSVKSMNKQCVRATLPTADNLHGIHGHVTVGLLEAMQIIIVLGNSPRHTAPPPCIISSRRHKTIVYPWNKRKIQQRRRHACRPT